MKETSRRTFMKTITVGAASVLTQRPSFAEEKKRPNIILIMADDVGYECFGCYGSKKYKTPRIDQMANEGVRFTHCHSTPLCTPSRIKIMTGKDNVRNYCDFGAFPEGETTFSGLLKDAGYATGFSGKWQLEYSDAKIYPEDVGFEDVCRVKAGVYWNTTLSINGKEIPADQKQYGPDLLTDYVVEYIRKRGNSKKPFLFYFPMTLVHWPYNPVPGIKKPKSKAQQRRGSGHFVEMVNYMDSCVGRILDALKESKLDDNTVVIFTADNGTEYHITSTLNGESIRGAKGQTTDHATHVPLVVKGPSVKAGSVCEDLIDFSDFFPALLEIAGAGLPKGLEIDGRSFWPQCRGEKGNPRQWLFNYYFPRPYAERGYDERYSHNEIRWARSKRYKLYGDGRFYDVFEDVMEKRPLLPEQSAKERAALQTVLDKMPEHGAGIDRSRLHQ